MLTTVFGKYLCIHHPLIWPSFSTRLKLESARVDHCQAKSFSVPLGKFKKVSYLLHSHVSHTIIVYHQVSSVNSMFAYLIFNIKFFFLPFSTSMSGRKHFSFYNLRVRCLLLDNCISIYSMGIHWFILHCKGFLPLDEKGPDFIWIQTKSTQWTFT